MIRQPEARNGFGLFRRVKKLPRHSEPVRTLAWESRKEK